MPTRAGSLPNVNQIGQHQQQQQQQQQQHVQHQIQQQTTTLQQQIHPTSHEASSPIDGKIDLQDCLNNLEEIKNGCLLERSGSVRGESSSATSATTTTNRSRNVSPSPMNRMSHGPNSNSNSSGSSFHTSPSHHPQHLIDNNNNHNHGNLQFNHQKRSQSPYSTSNQQAYLSPPSDGHWRRTNSDSALHQSAQLSTTTNQMDGQLGGFNHLIHGNHNNNQMQTMTNLNGSPRHRSQAMIIGGQLLTNGNSMDQWDPSKGITNQQQQLQQHQDLLSVSLPDQNHRPRSCEVPGINIFPSQDDNGDPTSPNSTSGHPHHHHHHIPITSNTGSLPDLTNLNFPVPLHAALDSDDPHNVAMQQQQQQASSTTIINVNTGPNSPYSNGPDSPFSPSSSHNSNLSPPPPCNMIGGGNYQQTTGTGSGSQSPRRQASPGPSPSPTSSRRRAHHNVNNLVIGNHRHQQQQQQQQQSGQVCYTNLGPRGENQIGDQSPQRHIPSPHRASSNQYLNDQNSTPHQYNRYKSPPRITVEVTKTKNQIKSKSVSMSLENLILN